MALQSCSISSMNSFLNNVYFIPSYQREYSWEEVEIEDFWEDLEVACESNDTDHFFGQIVVHNDDINRRKYIIDGQQRTITSMIFMRTLQVFYKRLYDNNKTLDEADYRAADISSIHLGRRGNLHLHLSSTSDDQFFQNYILFGLPNDNKPRKKSYKRMKKAYAYFYNKIQKSLEQDSSDDKRLETLDKYYNAFISKFNVLYMEATKLDEAFVIFETLNARGRDLETADLLKNYIFSQTRDIKLAQNEWEQMINTLDQIDPTKYIRHFWNASHVFAREKDLYRSISKTISTPRESTKLLTDLKNCAQYYHDICNPFDPVILVNQDLLESLKALKILKATTFYPIVLAVYLSPEIGDNDKEKYLVEIIRVIEVYVFRNVICGSLTNKAEKDFAAIAKDIYDGRVDSSYEIIKRLKDSIVSDQIFYEMFKCWAGSKTSKETVRYILRKIHKFYDKTNELSLDNTEVHIEHIMPIEASKWQISDDVHEEYLWRLGNLALLSGPFNRAISNLPFNEKKKYYADSKIEPNSQLANVGEWTEQEIAKRQEQFAKCALKIWAK